jgi:hypothetical protein
MVGIPGVNTLFTPEQIDQLLARLSEPFDPEVVEWRVTNTSGKRGQVVAYADQRAYTDRLNELLTPAGWTREYTVQTVQNFEVPRKDGKSTIITAKVMVTSKVTIHGLGSHSGTGEEWAIDENALTRAEAQAFKRACSCFGLGRYFYDLPRAWVDLDENRRPLQLPALPEWALPKIARSTARQRRSRGQEGNTSQHGVVTGGNSSARKSSSAPAHRSTANGISEHGGEGRRSNGLYGDELRRAVQELGEEVGFSLARSVVQAVAGKDEIGAVKNNAHLTSIMDKLTDLARGVRRLRAATETAGAGVYARLCQELNLASDAIDDIPNREVLRELVNRMEAAAAEAIRRDGDGPAESSTSGSNGSNRSADGGACTPRGDGGIGERVAQLRDRLLREARRVSTARRKGIGDVIALASKGTFGFADLTKLTDADADKVEAALAELGRICV